MPAEFEALACHTPGMSAVRASSCQAFPRHMHDEFGIGVILSGAQRSASGRGPVEAGPGSLITVNPGEIHDGIPLSETGRRWHMLYLAPALVADLAADLQQDRIAGSGTGQEFTLPVLQDQRVASTFLTLFEKVTGSTARQDRLAVETALLQLAARLVDSRAKTVHAGGPAALMRAVERIDSDPADMVSLAELAQMAGLSRFQFLRAFCRQTGLTPHAYQVQRRIQLARRLILSGEPLATAASSAGFADQSHMTRLFRRTLGYTPGALATAFGG